MNNNSAKIEFLWIDPELFEDAQVNRISPGLLSYYSQTKNYSDTRYYYYLIFFTSGCETL